MNGNAPKFDPSNFKNDSYVRRLDKPWGYELHWVADDQPYMGKLLHINAGTRFSLQVHDKKSESWLLISGQAELIWETAAGELITTQLVPEKGFTTQIGQKHRLVGVTDCDIIEVSTPEIGTTWRLEDDYSRPDETEELRKSERS
ncbi:MAG TPA: hypothetical protein VIH90_02010 [Candidatus Saccharimonadales bacterium]